VRTHRAYAVLALAAAPLLTGVPAAHAEAFFQVETSAAAVHVTVTQEPASSIITASLFDDAISYAASEFDSGGSSEALAAPAFPGKLVVQGPQLLCTQLFSCPVTPPDYPLLADASYPRQRHDTATLSGRPMGAGPFIVTPLSASARAAADSNKAGTEAGRADLLAATPGAVTVGASAASTAVTRTGQHAIVTVTASASDITIGGLVHVASVRAVDRVVATAGQPPAAHPRVTVTGVTVAGHAATIDDKGVHVDGAGAGDFGREIARHGLTIRTVGVRHRHTRNASRSEALGLRIDVAVPVNGVPYIPNPLPPLPPPFDQIPALPGINANGSYVGHVTIGAVGAAAGIGSEPLFSLGSVTSPSPPGTTPTGQSTPTRAAPLGGNELVGTLATSPPSTPPSVAGRSPGALRGFVDLVSKNQLETLYAVLALGSLALFIGWRATAVLRAGRSR
jgi:hypothetical protein